MRKENCKFCKKLLKGRRKISKHYRKFHKEAERYTHKNAKSPS